MKVSEMDTAKKNEILNSAIFLMETGCEIRSALKQAASDFGIPYGSEMGAFVAWAEKRLDEEADQ